MFSGEFGSRVAVVISIAGIAGAVWGLAALCMSFQGVVQSVKQMRLEVERVRLEVRQDAERSRLEQLQGLKKVIDELKQIDNTAVTGRIKSIEYMVDAQQRSGWLLQ